jgi:hypothetical protein
MITIKITEKEIFAARWEGLKVVNFKRLQNTHVSLFSKIKDKIIFYDETNQFKKGLKVKLDRRPVKNENYKNLKHQMYFYLIEAINNGKLSINCNFPKDEFVQEIQQLKQNKNNDSGKFEMIPRKEIFENLGRDIHLVDLLSYRFFAVLKNIQ